EDVKFGSALPSDLLDDEYLIRIIDPSQLITSPIDQVGPYHTVAKIYPDVEMWFEEMTNTRNRKFAAIVLLPNRTPSQVEEFIRTNIHNHRGVDVCFVISDDGNLYDTQWCTTFSPEMRWSRSIDDRWCDNVQAACCTASDLYINHYQKQEMR
ncbi:unnamed protein product, partial [Rotaria sp. Silwood1]